MMTHDELKALALSDAETKKEYDALESEFTLFNEMLKARNKSGLSQAEVAKRMNTQQSTVARLESAGGIQQHSPSLNTLKKYADAVGCTLDIRLTPKNM